MECKYEPVIEMLREDVKEIKKDVKELLRFRWKFAGGAAVLGMALYVAMFFVEILFGG